jgi:hypothetical protein
MFNPYWQGRSLAAWRAKSWRTVRDNHRRGEGEMPSLKSTVGEQQGYCKDLASDFGGCA